MAGNPNSMTPSKYINVKLHFILGVVRGGEARAMHVEKEV